MNDLIWAVNGPPIGVWSTTLGTADALMQDVLRLRPDGTGSLESSSVMSGVEKFPVRWEHLDVGTLRIARFLPDEDPQTDPPDWETVHYRQDLAQTDTATHIPVLRNTDDDHFWILAGPVRLLPEAAAL